MNWKKKHKLLEEKYEHYICPRCMEIGANEAIEEFIGDLECQIPRDEMITKWVERRDEI